MLRGLPPGAHCRSAAVGGSERGLASDWWIFSMECVWKCMSLLLVYSSEEAFNNYESGGIF
jgi:hypothetical protein